MTTEPATTATMIADLRATTAAAAEQLNQTREQIAQHKGEIARIDQALASVTLNSKPLEVLATRERRQQLLAEVGRLNQSLMPLEQKHDELNLRLANWDSKLVQARRLLEGLAGGLQGKAFRGVDVSDLASKAARARALLESAGETVPPIVIKL